MQLDPGPDLPEALIGLQALPERPVSEHVETFEAVHRALQDALAELDGA